MEKENLISTTAYGMILREKIKRLIQTIIRNQNNSQLKRANLMIMF